ncbi:putative chromatin regulator PHD family [Helianthus annuus]|nr:putative chromatin regulator PHD family [Helianthus annuus]KAJ0941166.1 putative chromatin regulator PHD family [Helianthus annuus]
MMKVIEHEHPLKLVDLQVNVEDVDDKSDDEEEKEKEEDLVPQDEFSCTCKRCDEDINGYYRYYYKCIHDSCDFALHKFCAELPETLKHATHPHPFILRTIDEDWTCVNCLRGHKPGACYECICCYWLRKDVNCVVEVDKRRIYHPSHPHPLVSLCYKPILCQCNACGKEHKGVFFQCTACPNFAIHNDCAFLPKRLLIQHATNAIFSHTHPLTLSYSFPPEEIRAKHNPRCRVCDGNFYYDLDVWIYKCEKCIYYAHLDCATSRRESFMSILSIGGGPTVKNFKDVDYPNLLRLPFPDETCSIPKHLFFKKLGPADYGNHEVSVQHMNRQHELILVDTAGSIGSTSSSKIMCHNPMKKIELLCSGCVRPITEMPFYKCRAKEDESCNFALHEWCTRRLPTKVDNHPGHPRHPLLLMTNIPNMFNIFRCGVCLLDCNGFAYGCVECEFYVDVTCGFMPERITHESHPNHLLSIVKEGQPSGSCLMCRLYVSPYTLNFSCSFCDVYIHPWCALLLPKTVRHPYDKHPMHISYLPIENHKSEYFCEICEEELDPHKCFYHCDECSQSVHSDCAPLILQSETETHSRYRLERGVYRFLNMKFGSIHKKTDGHPHPLTFAQGIESDGGCSVCHWRLRFEMILRCSECEFAVHHDCLENWNKS